MTQLVRATAAIVALVFIAYPTFTEGPLRSVEHVLTPLSILRPEATVIFAGDMLFDRTIRGAMETKGEDFIFSCIDEGLSEAVGVVANLL